MKEKLNFFNKKVTYILIILLIILSITSCGSNLDNNIADQTNVEGAEFIIKDDGVPIMNIESVGEVYHPAWIGIYALQYAGVESFYEKKVDIDSKKFNNCINWIKDNYKKTKEGYIVWEYNFDSTYNDITIKKNWYSSFGQALVIESLVEHYKITGDKSSIELAEEAVKVLFEPLDENGLLFISGEDIWFEEIPSSNENPSHILNGHMRALIALQKLYQATSEAIYNEWFLKGVTTLEEWLPLYDTGYWLKYDLNPKKQDLLFRFNNKYGYELVDLPVDKIIFTDPVTDESITIDVGSDIDAVDGEPRISGNGWDQIEELDGKTIRRLMPVIPETNKEGGGELYAPYTYFYLNLPSEWVDNLRTEWYEMTVIYKDEKAANLNVQMRSIAPGDSFVDLNDGDILLTGSGEWKEWKIPVRASDIGWWTGELYAEKHYEYLEWLQNYSSNLERWTDIARGYINNSKHIDPIIIKAEKKELPKQVPPVAAFSFDSDYVVRQHIADKEKTEYYGGSWDGKSQIGKAVYSPYVIAVQAIEGNKMLTKSKLYDLTDLIQSGDRFWKSYNWITENNNDLIEKEAAFKWLEENKKIIRDSYTWNFDYENCYNDMIQFDGWQSAFSQRYVIDAFLSINNKETVLKAAYAYKYETGDGGLSSYNKANEIWFEEVPNNSHILNAHLASIVALERVYDAYKDNEVKNIYEDGLESIVNNLYRFDTGYWTKYDMNPKKEILIQLDWLSGEKSPLIDEVLLYNPISNTATQIDVGQDNDFDAYPNIAGLDWSSSKIEDGKSVREFTNGYKAHSEAVQGGTRHNVYINAVLPEQEFNDYFDLPTHKLIIKYKDVVEGKFSIKTQSINEGNYLAFTEIPNGIVECLGDNEWKTITIDIRPQDMGWYMGADYQIYHNEQLQLIAESTNNWLLNQYLDKWNYYLESHNNRTEVIINNLKEERVDITKNAVISDSSSIYDGYGIENSLDGDPNDDYTAFVESTEEQFFTISFNSEVDLSSIELYFESIQNIVSDYTISFYLDDKEVNRIDLSSQNSMVQTINFESIKVDKIKFTAKKYNGQQRILLRQIRFFI